MPWRAGAADLPDLSSSGDADRRARRSAGGGPCRHRAGFRHRPVVDLCDCSDFCVGLSDAAGSCSRLWHGDVIPFRALAIGKGRGSARREPVQAAERHSGRTAAQPISGDCDGGASGACRACPCGDAGLAAHPCLHWWVSCRDRASWWAWRGASVCVAAASCAALCAGTSGAVRHHPPGIAGAGHRHCLRAWPVRACHCGVVTGQYRAADRHPCCR